MVFFCTSNVGKDGLTNVEILFSFWFPFSFRFSFLFSQTVFLFSQTVFLFSQTAFQEREGNENKKNKSTRSESKRTFLKKKSILFLKLFYWLYLFDCFCIFLKIVEHNFFNGIWYLFISTIVGHYFSFPVWFLRFPCRERERLKNEHLESDGNNLINHRNANRGFQTFFPFANVFFLPLSLTPTL